MTKEQVEKTIKRGLDFLSLTDRAGNLSISNAAVIILITKMAIAPFDWVTAAGLLVTLLNYSHKRYEGNKAAAIAQDVSDREQLQNGLNEVLKEMATLKASQENVLKQADEVRKIVNNNNLKDSLLPANFYGRNK